MVYGKGKVNNMRFGLCQLNIEWENKMQNYEKAKQFIQESKEKGCDIIFFPEMSFTGFSMNIERTQEFQFETVNLMKKYAMFFGISVGFGWVKACGEIKKAENHYTIVNQNGEVISDYIKIHPFSYSSEDKYFIAGNKVVCCDIHNIKISTFICYDLRFPEIFQAISNQATYIFVPANWPGERDSHWVTLAKARAIENQIYICGINCVGNMNGVKYVGNSLIINPDGKVECNLMSEEGIIIHDTNNAPEEMREIFPIKSDRRNKFYSKYYL